MYNSSATPLQVQTRHAVQGHASPSNATLQMAKAQLQKTSNPLHPSPRKRPPSQLGSPPSSQVSRDLRCHPAPKIGPAPAQPRRECGAGTVQLVREHSAAHNVIALIHIMNPSQLDPWAPAGWGWLAYSKGNPCKLLDSVHRWVHTRARAKRMRYPSYVDLILHSSAS